MPPCEVLGYLSLEGKVQRRVRASNVCAYPVSVSVYRTGERRWKGFNTVYYRGLKVEFYQC